jgi:hypothetical protein
MDIQLKITRIIKTDPKIKIIFILIIFFGLSVLAKSSWAATYWVHPSGTSPWGSGCTGSTDPGVYCTLDDANRNAVAGDTVYFKAGIYPRAYNGMNGGAISPYNSGSLNGTTCSSRLIFAKGLNEANGSVIIEPSPLGETNEIGLDLGEHGTMNCIKIDGITFSNFLHYFAYVRNGSSYNEITNCKFTSTSPAYMGANGFIIGSDNNTNNWIHDSIFEYRGVACQEGVDNMLVGSYSSDTTSDNNTIENNIFRYAGHSTLMTVSRHNVIKNNILHNEPWLACTGRWQQNPSTDTITVGTGNKSLRVSAGLGWSYGTYLTIFRQSDPTIAMEGYAVSYNNSTGDLTLHANYSSGSGSYSDWYVYGGLIPVYVNPAYNGKFGHRNMQIGDDVLWSDNFNLVEGNRFGFASTNPGNTGATNLQIAAPGNIVRYNYSFGAMQSGLEFKWPNAYGRYSGGVNNRVYNNTLYHNGWGYNWHIYGGDNASQKGIGVLAYSVCVGGSNDGATCYGNGSCVSGVCSAAPTLNVVKNNIVYDSGVGDICEIWAGTGCSYTTDSLYKIENNWCTNTAGGCSASGNPNFKNPDVSNPTHESVPDLSLTDSSPANIKNGATYLTTVDPSDTGSGPTLKVVDARYFQDGTWGSYLARTSTGLGGTFQSDWICLGATPGTCTPVAISSSSSINYTTNSITLANSVSRTPGVTPVWLYKDSSGNQVINRGNIGYASFGAAPYGAASPIDTTPPAAPTGLSVK